MAGHGGTVSRTANKKLTKLHWPSRKRLPIPKPLIVLLKPKTCRGTTVKISGSLRQTGASPLSNSFRRLWFPVMNAIQRMVGQPAVMSSLCPVYFRSPAGHAAQYNARDVHAFIAFGCLWCLSLFGRSDISDISTWSCRRMALSRFTTDLIAFDISSSFVCGWLSSSEASALESVSYSSLQEHRQHQHLHRVAPKNLHHYHKSSLNRIKTRHYGRIFSSISTKKWAQEYDTSLLNILCVTWFVTSSFAVSEAVTRIKSMHLIKSCLKTRKKRENMEIKDIIT